MSATQAQIDAAAAAITKDLDAYIEANVPEFFQGQAEAALHGLAPQLAADALAAAKAVPPEQTS